MNADQLVRAAYKLKPAERAKMIAAVSRSYIVGEGVPTVFHFDPSSPISGVKAVARIAAGLVDLAQSHGVDMVAPEWVDAETDPIALLMQGEIFGTLLAEFFEDGRPHTKTALTFAAIPRHIRLAAAQEWVREALSGNFRTADDPLNDVYALQRIARASLAECRYSHPSQLGTEWVDPEDESRGALLQASAILEALSKPEPASEAA